MTIEQLRRRLRAEHARMGFEGRLALTLEQERSDAAYITHWMKPAGGAFEDCVAVGHGSLADCLTALRRYADGYRRKPTVDEVGRTLGLAEVSPKGAPHHCVAAE